ncbi:MAG: hypothetical protein EOO09_00035 [Chitinophagaceae bacterium]|nr:MAG: hypothetical protein EOO09_00035 [Chitinophagaceae bacterium]
MKSLTLLLFCLPFAAMTQVVDIDSAFSQGAVTYKTLPMEFHTPSHAIITESQASVYLDNLVSNGFLSKDAPEVFFREYSKGTIKVEVRSSINEYSYSIDDLMRETILHFCHDALVTELGQFMMTRKKKNREKKFRNTEELPGSANQTIQFSSQTMWGVQSIPDCISDETSVTGLTRLRTLRLFHDTGLINDAVFGECKAALQSAKLQLESDLLQFMLQRSTMASYYETFRNEQLNHLDTLIEKGVIAPGRRETIRAEFNDGRLPGMHGMVAYSNNYLLADLKAFPPDPLKVYPEMFRLVQQLLPGFRYSNLRVKVMESDDHNLIRQDVHLQFEADGLVYRHVFFHDYRHADPKDDNPNSVPSVIDVDFQKPINRWLAETGSPYRLHQMRLPPDPAAEYQATRVGLILLNESQAPFVQYNNRLSAESFDRRFTRAGVKTLLEDIRSIGLLDNISKPDIDKALEEISRSDFRDYGELLAGFPGLVVFFDWETGNLEDPYRELSGLFSIASRGAFRLENITDDFANGFDKKATATIFGFTLNGIRYEKALDFQGDWLNPGFLEMIITAIEQAGVDGKIYKCIDDGQAAGYLFLNAAQFAFMQSKYPGLCQLL